MKSLTIVVDVRENFNEYLDYKFQHFEGKFEFIFVIHHKNHYINEIKEKLANFSLVKVLINEGKDCISDINNIAITNVTTNYVCFTNSKSFIMPKFDEYFENLVKEYDASLYVFNCKNIENIHTNINIIQSKNIIITPEINYIFSNVKKKFSIYKTDEIKNSKFTLNDSLTNIEFSKNIFNFKNKKIIDTQTTVVNMVSFKKNIYDSRNLEKLMSMHKLSIDERLVTLLIQNIILNNMQDFRKIEKIIDKLNYDCIFPLAIIYRANMPIEKKMAIISRFFVNFNVNSVDNITKYYNTSFTKEIVAYKNGPIKFGFMFDNSQKYIDSLLLDYIYHLNNFYILKNIETYLFNLNETCKKKYAYIFKDSSLHNASEYLMLSELDQLILCTESYPKNTFIPPNLNIKTVFEIENFPKLEFNSYNFINQINNQYSFEYSSKQSACVVINKDTIHYIHEVIRISERGLNEITYYVFVPENIYYTLKNIVKDKNIHIILNPNYFTFTKYIKKFDFAIYFGSESKVFSDLLYLKYFNIPVISFDDILIEDKVVIDCIDEMMEIGNLNTFSNFLDNIPNKKNSLNINKSSIIKPIKKKTIVISVVAPNIIGGIEIILLNLIDALGEIYAFTIVYYQYIGDGENLFQAFDNVICFRDVPDNYANIEQEISNAEVILVPLLSSLNVASTNLRKIFNKYNYKLKALYLGEIGNITERKLFGDAQVNAYNNFIKALNDSYIKINELGVLTKKNADIINAKYPLIEGIYVPNLLFSPNKNIKKYRENYIYIGRLVKADKDIFELLNIAKYLKEGCRIDVFGTGADKEEFKKKIIEEGLENKIKLCGTLSNKEIVDHIANYKALILCSKSEGMPNVILESYFSSTPVVIYDSFTNASEIVDDGISGFLIENRDSRKFAEKMMELGELSSEKYHFFEKGAASKVLKKEEILKYWINFIKINEPMQEIGHGITIITMEDSKYIPPNNNSDNIQHLRIEDGVLKGKIKHKKFMFIHPSTTEVNYEKLLEVTNKYDVDLIQYNLYNKEIENIYLDKAPRFTVDEKLKFYDVSIFDKIYSTEVYSDFYAPFYNTYNGYNTNLDDIFYKRFYFTTMNIDNTHIYYKQINNDFVHAELDIEVEELFFTFMYHIFSLSKYRIINHKLLHDSSGLNSLYVPEKLKTYNEFMTIYLLLKEARNV